MFLEPFPEQLDIKDSKPILLSQCERRNNKQICDLTTNKIMNKYTKIPQSLAPMLLTLV
jgi:hypothetical protein